MIRQFYVPVMNEETFRHNRDINFSASLQEIAQHARQHAAVLVGNEARFAVGNNNFSSRLAMILPTEPAQLYMEKTVPVVVYTKEPKHSYEQVQLILEGLANHGAIFAAQEKHLLFNGLVGIITGRKTSIGNGRNKILVTTLRVPKIDLRVAMAARMALPIAERWAAKRKPIHIHNFTAEVNMNAAQNSFNRERNFSEVEVNDALRLIGQIAGSFGIGVGELSIVEGITKRYLVHRRLARRSRERY